MKPFWNDNVVNWFQLWMALAGVALLGFGYYLADKKRHREFQTPRDALLVVLGVMGFFAYFNFGNLHFGNFVHTWDTYHYYMGAKYFPELKYELLYDCTVIADAEDLGRQRVETRVVTELRTNVMVSAQSILAKPEVCKDRFTPERWSAFKSDLAWFRNRVNQGKWEQILKDHGYNATPVWNALGYLLTNMGRATDAQVVFLCLLDPLFLIAMFALIFWAFGWRVTAVALLFFGTDIPGRFLWTGGAFLRHDWLFWMVGSICLLKKDRPFVAGAFIAYATLLRLFPGLAIAGPVCAFIELYRRNKKLDPALLRYFAGGIAATVVLVLISFALSGGPKSWADFARNSQKHASTPLTNHMGLRTVMSYRPSTTGAVLLQRNATDPWGVWKQARLEKFDQAKPLFALVCVGFLVLLYFAVSGGGAEPWLAAALGTGMIAVGAELTCYYYCFFVGVVIAFYRRMEVGILISLLSAIWLFIDRAPFPAMSQWDDEQYVAMSVFSIVTYALILWGFTKWGPKYALLPEPDPAPVPAPSVQTDRYRDKKKKKRR